MATRLDYDSFKTQMQSVYGNMNLTEDHLQVVYQFYLDSSDNPAIDDTMAWYKVVFIQD